MDYKYIEQLLDRYFQGETTLQEEQILKAFFAQGEADMPESLSRYVPLFAMMSDKETLGSDFDERLLAMTEGNKQVKARVIKMTDRLRPLFKAAAIVAILLTLGNAINQSLKSNNTWVDVNDYAVIKAATTDPAVAYDQVSDSLTLAKDNISATALPTDSLADSGLD